MPNVLVNAHGTRYNKDGTVWNIRYYGCYWHWFFGNKIRFHPYWYCQDTRSHTHTNTLMYFFFSHTLNESYTLIWWIHIRICINTNIYLDLYTPQAQTWCTWGVLPESINTTHMCMWKSSYLCRRGQGGDVCNHIAAWANRLCTSVAISQGLSAGSVKERYCSVLMSLMLWPVPGVVDCAKQWSEKSIEGNNQGKVKRFHTSFLFCLEHSTM